MNREAKWGLVVSVLGILVEAGVSMYQAHKERAEQERLDELEGRVSELEKHAHRHQVPRKPRSRK